MMLMALEFGGDEHNFEAVEKELNKIRCAPGERRGGHEYIHCSEGKCDKWMRLGDYLGHWRAKHDPRKDRKPKPDKAVYHCEDCTYKTAYRKDLDKHLKGGCPRKKREEKREEKERERREKNNETSKKAH